MFFILGIIGAVIWLIGHIWLLIEAFKESILWGLACLFLPIVGLIFIIIFWEKAKQPFGTIILGVVLMFVGGVGMPRNHRFSALPPPAAHRA